MNLRKHLNAKHKDKLGINVLINNYVDNEQNIMDDGSSESEDPEWDVVTDVRSMTKCSEV